MLSRKLGFKTPLAERFWAKVDKRGPDECWLWLGAKIRGYGQIWDGNRVIGAHRASLILDGRDPGKLDALHSCHNPSCVNPAHLRPGTEKENAQDAIDANRFVHLRHEVGERNPTSVLKEHQVLKIRERASNGDSRKIIAADFGVSRATIRKCVNRETWKHI